MALTFKDYYDVLNVSRTASQEEIQKAFRKLARQYHPDVAKDKTQAEAKFKEINEAYEVLRDPQKRAKYDRLGAAWQQEGGFQPPPEEAASWGFRPGERFRPEDFTFEFGGTGFSDFFEAFFGSGRRGFDFRSAGNRDARTAATRGPDVEADILVTLEEVLRGSLRQISLRAPGDGRQRTETLQVRIPPGIREGQLIRLAGKGEPGPAGGPPGDLFLRVRLASHPDFRVQDFDLHYDLDLAPWEAVLGCQLRVALIGQSVSLKIPPGTQSGDKLRLRGLGLPRSDGTRGDLYVVARIQAPDEISAEERKLWEQLAQTSSFNPRNP